MGVERGLVDKKQEGKCVDQGGFYQKQLGGQFFKLAKLEVFKVTQHTLLRVV